MLNDFSDPGFFKIVGGHFKPDADTRLEFVFLRNDGLGGMADDFFAIRKADAEGAVAEHGEDFSRGGDGLGRHEGRMEFVRQNGKPQRLSGRLFLERVLCQLLRECASSGGWRRIADLHRHRRMCC